MLLRLFLLFTLVPVGELWLLIRIGERIGAPATVGMVVLTGAAGAWFARSQGAKVLASFQQATAQGRLPADEILDGVLILLGGVMLITPGVITDVLGLALVAPFTRRPIRQGVKRTFAGRMRVVSYGAPPFGGAPFGAPPPPPKNDKDVIDV